MQVMKGEPIRIVGYNVEGLWKKVGDDRLEEITMGVDIFCALETWSKGAEAPPIEEFTQSQRVNRERWPVGIAIYARASSQKNYQVKSQRIPPPKWRMDLY